MNRGFTACRRGKEARGKHAEKPQLRRASDREEPEKARSKGWSISLDRELSDSSKEKTNPNALEERAKKKYKARGVAGEREGKWESGNRGEIFRLERSGFSLQIFVKN